MVSAELDNFTGPVMPSMHRICEYEKYAHIEYFDPMYLCRPAEYALATLWCVHVLLLIDGERVQCCHPDSQVRGSHRRLQLPAQFYQVVGKPCSYDWRAVIIRDVDLGFASPAAWHGGVVDVKRSVWCSL
jgi:hypothetical protein